MTIRLDKDEAKLLQGLLSFMMVHIDESMSVIDNNNAIITSIYKKNGDLAKSIIDKIQRAVYLAEENAEWQQDREGKYE